MGEGGENEEGVGNGRKRAPRSTLSAVRSVFVHAQPADSWLMGLGLVGAIGDGVSMPIMSIIMIKMVNSLGAGPSSPNFEHAISQSSLNLVYLSACCFALCFLEGYCWTRTGERQASRMRQNYLKAVLRQDIGYFDLKFASTSEVVTSISSDSLIIQDVLGEKVPNFVMHCAHFFGSYIASFILLWRLALVALPGVVLLLIPGMIYGRVLLGLAREIHSEYDKAGLVAQQAFSSIRTVYSFVAERRTVSAFSAALDRSVRLGLRQGFVKGLALGGSSITFTISALVLWYSSRLVMYHGANGGTIFAVGSCIVSGGISFGLGLSNVKYFGEAMAAAERMEEVIARRPPIDSESGEGEEMERVEGEVEFKEVRFAYPARQDAEVFRGFSLRVEAGKRLALVGGSGSGKSTAIALLQRFYDLDGGEITLDGVDIRRLRLKWLRAQMGLVSQEPVLFATTIKENILLGKEDAAMDEVVAAAKTANAHGFISELPLGYDTQVGERGIQMSGGQKQRLAIARAIVRAPKILLLDEATSALDFTSEQIVQAALDVASVGRTTLVIAHRLSTIRNADSIAFVQAGQVTELGSHDQLLTNPDSHYSTLFRIQQSHPPSDDQHDNIGATDRSSRSSHSMSRRISTSSSTRSTGEIRWGEDEKSQKDQVKLPAPSLLRLLKMSAPEWRRAVVGGVSALIYGGVQPTYSYFLGSFIMVYFLKDREEMKEKTRAYSLIFVGLFVFSLAVSVLQHYNLGFMGECLTRRVREHMISKMLTFEVGWFDGEENSTGAICSRLAKDANMVRSLVGDRMSLLIQALSAVAVACTMGLIIAWRLAIVMIATQPMIIICFYTENVLLKAMSKKGIKAQSESSTLAAEAVGNIRTVTAFSSQHRILHLFDLAQDSPRRQSIHQSWVAGISLASSKSLNHCIWALCYWYGGFLVSQGYITSKELIQTFLIIHNTGRIIAQAGSMTTDLVNGVESVASVFAVLDHITSIEPDDPEGYPAKTLGGAVELCGIEFAYPARPDVIVLSRFSLFIEAGRSTALVGSSGSGKSTIISLIERFYDPLRGVVRIDGRDIRSYHLRSLRRHISLVGQEPALVAGTIRENIMYGVDEASDAELEAAARAANVHEFISGLKDGYGTWCGEQGIQLSGGQKQRVAIARAILKNPVILLLDEATSALDGQSEKLVQEALERLMIGRTSVVVAHRLSTIRNCDVIAVLHKGLLVEKGSHASLLLMGPKGNYYRLVNLQQGKQQMTDQCSQK